MVFTHKQMAILEKAWKNKESITIKGVNFYGEPFETTGRITSSDDGKMGANQIYGYIFLEYGTSKASPDRKQTEIFAPFESEMIESINRGNLAIISVEYKGKVIFTNPNKEEILETAKENNSKKQKTLVSEGRNILPKCPVVEKLTEMIGKPIIIQNEDRCNKGVLISLTGVSNYGDPIVKLAVGPGIANTFVKATTKLYTVDNDGKISLIAENDLLEFMNAVRPVLDNMQSHKDKGKE